jgi:hypothetical protein
MRIDTARFKSLVPAAALLWMAAVASTAQADALLVKGAWPSASDTVTPVPEGGTIARDAYDNAYFGLKYTLASGWNQQVEGPPPSETGYYVLAQIEPLDRSRRSIEGHAMIAAQDMFFSSTPASTPAELIAYAKQHLDPDYKIERQPVAVRLAHRDFIRFDYRSPAAQMHWHVLATQIRCHTVEFIFTGRDTLRMTRMVNELDSLQVSDRDAPTCIKDFANPANLLASEEPVLPQSRFNPIPVRIIIGTDGRIQHIHFISAFPEQGRGISEALSQWRFKPYLLDGRPVAVETGIMFGRAPPTQAQNAP